MAVFCKSTSQQEIKAISPSTLWMLWAVLIRVTFCSSVANWWPGSNPRFWSNPFSIVPNASIVTGTVFVLAFHIQLTAMSSSLYWLSFSVSFVLTFGSSGRAMWISRQVFSLFHAVLYQVDLLLLFHLRQPVRHTCWWYRWHIALSGICS